MTDQTDDVEALAMVLADTIPPSGDSCFDDAPRSGDPEMWDAAEEDREFYRAHARSIVAAGWLPHAEVARRVDEHLAEVERRISGLPMRGPDNSTRHASTIRSVATHIVRDYRQEVRS